MKHLIVAISLAALLATAPALAQSTAPAGSSPMGTSSAPAATAGKAGAVDAKDRRFVEKAAMDNLTEIQLGQLAQQKAADPAVKQLGVRLVADHQQANAQLQQVAQQLGIQLPTKLNREYQAEYDRLAKLSGAPFDRSFVNGTVKDHQADVKEFQKEAQSAKAPEVKSYAAQTAPVLQQHLTMAQQAQSGLGSTGSSTGTGKAPGGAATKSQKSSLDASERAVTAQLNRQQLGQGNQ
jgi:putative membrane protein